MAVTTEGRSLTEAHRLAQIDIGEATKGELAAIWERFLDPSRIEATFPDYFAEALSMLEAQHARSARLASGYLEGFHEAEARAVGANTSRPLDIREASGLARDQAMASLFYTGPVQVRHGVANMGRTIGAASDVALGQTQAAAKRLSMQGGRSTIMGTVDADSRVKGYARVTDADPCAFCAMLASRGAVYKDDSFRGSDARFTGSGAAKVHDDCGCSMEPSYSRDSYESPGRSKEFEEKWGQVPGDLSPADQRRAFRGLHERGRIPDKYLRG